MKNGPEGDPDEDGLNNYYEFLASTNPYSADTDRNGTTDADEDYDGDKLTNIEEQQYSINPSEPDSDDDGLTDLFEVQQALDPADPISPYVARTLVNDGTGYLTLPKAPLVKGESLDPDGLRFNLPEWTLCAMVRLTDVPADDVIVVQRRVEVGDQSYLNYELGIARDTLVPYIRFQSASVSNTVSTATGRCSSMRGRTSAGASGSSSVRGRSSSRCCRFHRRCRDLSGIFCVTGVQDGDLVIGKYLIGELDEVSVWKEARNNDQIEALRGATHAVRQESGARGIVNGWHCCERPKEYSSIWCDDDVNNIDPTQQGGTVELWFRTDVTNRQSLISKKTETTVGTAAPNGEVLNYEIYVDTDGW
jgi:hypothetical protein